MAKYKEVFGFAKEKISDNKMVLNLAPEVQINASVTLKTADNKNK